MQTNTCRAAPRAPARSKISGPAASLESFMGNFFREHRFDQALRVSPL
jgi:hypothetical protein